MERRAGGQALPRASTTQGWSDAHPPPRFADYASRTLESYKGWGEGVRSLYIPKPLTRRAYARLPLPMGEVNGASVANHSISPSHTLSRVLLPPLRRPFEIAGP